MVKNVLTIKALREVKANIKNYLAVILIACLAVTLLTGIYANWQNFRYKVDDIYTKSNVANGYVLADSKTISEISTYLNDNNIDYEKRLYVPIKSGSDSFSLYMFTDNIKYNKPVYLEDDLNTNEIYVSETYLEKHEMTLPVTLDISASFNNINIETKLTITKTMVHPEALDNSTYYNDTILYVGYNAFIEAILKSNFGFLLNEELIKETIETSYNQILINDSNINNILTNIKEKYDVLYALELEDLPSNITIETDINQARDLLYIFPVIFYLVAMLIILTSISDFVSSESKNIGLLKSLGYTKREIMNYYLKIFMTLSLIGGLIGLVLGPLIIPKVMDQKYNILYALPKIDVPFFRIEYLLSIVLLLILCFFMTYLSIYQYLKLKPSEALRGQEVIKMKDTLLDKVKPLDNKVLSLKMAFRNMKRKVSRTLMVVLGVMGCSALLLAGFGIEDTLDNSINQEITLIPYDVSITYNKASSHYENLSQIEGIVDIDEYAKYEIEIEKDKLISSYVYVMPEKSHIFKPQYNKDSCLISTKVASSIGAKIGDEVKFIYNNTIYNITITDIIDVSFSQGIFISEELMLIPYEPTAAWLKTNNMNNKDLAKTLSDKEYALSAISMEEMLEQADNTIASIRIMTNTIKIFAILLALIVLFNLALLNFKERIKDIATLKVLGFTKLEIALSFLIEVLVLTVFGSLIGLALGYPLMYGVLHINENPLLSYIYKIDISSIIYTILITAGSSLLINILISLYTNKVKMAESLKSVD